MTEFLLGAATFVLAMVAFGLSRILLGPRDADRVMAAQLLGSGGSAVLMLLAVATGTRAAFDVALVLALLAAFAAAAFVQAAAGARAASDERADGG